MTAPLADGLNIHLNAANTKWKMYIKLPTYGTVIADQYSKNLESWSRPPFVLCTSQS
jgi:hypothetical protein